MTAHEFSQLMMKLFIIMPNTKKAAHQNINWAV